MEVIDQTSAKDISQMPAILDDLILKKNVPEDPPNQRLMLSEILQEKEWWRIYLNRVDHRRAFDKFQDNPGILYDKENSEGFQANMVRLYKRVLNNNEYANLFQTATLTWDTYNKFHELLTKGMGIEKRGKTDYPMFNLGLGNIAEDTKHDVLLGRPLLSIASEDGNPIAFLTLDGKSCQTGVKFLDCPLLVGAAFEKFHDQINAATNRRQQLQAIAWLIRFLHILHTFKDGNGRLNVYFLLPRLLLQYGFGPPIRLGGRFHPDTLHWLFNGGFSIDQIAVYLWHAQQRPGDDIEKLD